MARTASGRPMTAAAMAAPSQVKATVTPNHDSNRRPIGPLRPKASSSA